MQISQLRLRNVRNIAELDLELTTGTTVFIGANGAGKTSILEGAYVLSHGQSFRSGPNDVLVRRGAEAMSVRGEIARSSGPIRLGLSWQDGTWSPSINDMPAASLGEALREFALVSFNPGSHELVSGGSRERRRFLDWGVFHVEPEYLVKARQFRRALRQRNVLLKQGGGEADLDTWDAELVRTALPLADMRGNYFAAYALELRPVLALLLPELGDALVTLNRGWAEDLPLSEALQQVRARDRARGHTSRGPQRGDWTIRFAGAPSREQLSRGQEKLCALACVVAQARLYAATRGEWPVVVLDDLPSELDAEHQRLVVQMLCGTPAQVLVSGIEVPKCLEEGGLAARVFHVEHGRVRGLV